MEQPILNGRSGGKSLNPFDDDVDSELSDLSSGLEEKRAPSPVQQLEKCWTEIDSLLCSKSMDPFAMQELREHLSEVEKFLIKDRPESDGQTGPVLQYLLNENIVESIYMFSTRQKVYTKEIRITLLKFFTEVFTRSPQPVLIHQQILRPISKLLRASEGTDDHEMCASLVPLLHTMCILMQENQSLLDLFFIESHVHMQSRFLVFTQLIPHMHAGGEMGNRARDALLLCLSLADQLPGSSLSQFIAADSNFCQVLATGLSALYSGLPSTRDLVVDEWQSPLPVIEKAVPELRTFIQALDFCNSVLQMAPKVVCSTMLALVREGFLQQVMGAALLQSSDSAVMFSMAYMTIFLTHISNVALMREFLCYLMQSNHDNRSILNSLLQHISSSNHLLCAVALEFFYVLLDLNCEDVMLELILKYLLPGLHVMPNQLAIVGAPDLYAQAARKFLQLLPASCLAAEQMFLESIKRSLSPPPPSTAQPPQSLNGARSSSPPHFTASPLAGGLHLERPSPVHPVNPTTSATRTPLTNFPVLPPPSSHHPPPPPASSTTNPFDDPLPAHTPIARSRSGSDASTSSLVSMSSVSSAPQAVNNSSLANGTDVVKTKSSHTSVRSSTSFNFEYVSPEMAYFNSLATARELIKECATRCKCWSSIYDKCKVSKETLLQQENRRPVEKSLEMEDISSVQISITDEERNSAGRGEAADGEGRGSGFRSRSTTLAANSRLTRTSRLRDHDKLHSQRTHSSTVENSETRMVAGARSQGASDALAKLHLPSSQGGGLRRSGTISAGSRPQRGSPRQSPRLERRLISKSSQFEDKIGLFLKIVLDKLMDMMQHPPTVNMLLTRLVSRLACYPQPLLRSLLLNHQLVLKPGIPNLLSVLQYLKQTVDRYARTQEGFEKRLGRARKTMAYRAQVRNSQVPESRARLILLRQMASRTELEIPPVLPTPDSTRPSLEKTSSQTKMAVSPSLREEKSGELGGGGSRRQSVKKRAKKVSTDTLFAIVIFHEFLQELASISEEQSVMHSLLYLPKSTV